MGEAAERLSAATIAAAAAAGNALRPLARLAAARDLAECVVGPDTFSAVSDNLSDKDNDFENRPQLHLLGASLSDWRRLALNPALAAAQPPARTALAARTDAAANAAAADLARIAFNLPPNSNVTKEQIDALPRIAASATDAAACARSSALSDMSETISEMDASVESLAASVRCILKWISDVPCASEPHKHAAFASYYAAIVTNMKLKLECIKIDLMDCIYNGPLGTHIAQTRNELVAAAARINSLVSQTSNDLRSFGALDDHRKAIACEYAALSNELDQIQKDISRLSLTPARPNFR